MFDCEGRTDCCLMLLLYRNCPTPSLSRRRESVGELTLLLTVLVSNILISCVASKNDVVSSEPVTGELLWCLTVVFSSQEAEEVWCLDM